MPHDFKRFPELSNSQVDFYYFESPHKQIFEDFRAVVVKVHDGDSIRVMTDFRDFDFPIRIMNIKAPELDQEGGMESQRFLEQRLLGQEVEIKINPNIRIGAWGRLLGKVEIGSMDIGEESIMMGQSQPWIQEERHQLWA